MHPKLLETVPWADPWPGRKIIHDLPEADYHAAKSLISKSALDVFGGRSPQHYIGSLDLPEQERTDAMAIGGVFHIAVLEPDLFDRKVLVIPDLDMRSSTNRTLRDRLVEEDGQGKTVISAKHLPLVQGMAGAVRKHPAARRLLARGKPEVTALWTDPDTGLRCKARGDWVSDMDGVFCDLKSAANASPHEFARAAATHRYHVQDAKYSRAFEENDCPIEHFVFIVVEKEYPYCVGCYQLDETARLKGEELYMAELRLMKQCRDNDYWPGYGDKVMDMRLPGWATVTEST